MLGAFGKWQVCSCREFFFFIFLFFCGRLKIIFFPTKSRSVILKFVLSCGANPTPDTGTRQFFILHFFHSKKKKKKKNRLHALPLHPCSLKKKCVSTSFLNFSRVCFCVNLLLLAGSRRARHRRGGSPESGCRAAPHGIQLPRQSRQTHHHQTQLSGLLKKNLVFFFVCFASCTFFTPC